MYYVKKDNEMRNIFDGFNSLFMGDTRLLRTDVEETDNSYEITCEVPGIDKKNISIDFTDDTLTIGVKAEASSGKSYVRRERYNMSGSRSFYLKDADENSIKARLDNGLLYITITKKVPEEKNNKLSITIE